MHTILESRCSAETYNTFLVIVGCHVGKVKRHSQLPVEAFFLPLLCVAPNFSSVILFIFLNSILCVPHLIVLLMRKSQKAKLMYVPDSANKISTSTLSF